MFDFFKVLITNGVTMLGIDICVELLPIFYQAPRNSKSKNIPKPKHFDYRLEVQMPQVAQVATSKKR